MFKTAALLRTVTVRLYGATLKKVPVIDMYLLPRKHILLVIRVSPLENTYP